MDENQNAQEISKKGGMNPILPLAIVGLIVIAAIGIFAFQGQQKPTPQAVVETKSNPTTTTSNTNEAPTGVTSLQKYKDGTFNSEGGYVSPGGEESIDVTLILKGDIIESAEVKSNATRPNSVKFQGIFIENFKQFVVGKNINEVKLDKVAGSSLTPGGFNDALEKIKAEAKA